MNNNNQWGVGPLSQNCSIPRERGGRDGTSTCLDEREREKKKERAFGWNERVVVVTTRESAIVLLATGRGELLVFKLYRPGGLRPSLFDDSFFSLTFSPPFLKTDSRRSV